MEIHSSRGRYLTTISGGLIFVCLFIASAITVAASKESDRQEAITTFPSALVELTNSDRASLGLPALKVNPTLEAAAQLKVNDMVLKGYFSHNTPEGVTPWHWFTDAGYQYIYAGENIAVNFKDPKAINDAWMRSPKHKANIVSPQYTEVGIAVAEGRYKLQKTIFVVQMFGTPKPGGVAKANISKPTPVVSTKKLSNTAAAASALRPATPQSTPTRRR